MKKESEDKVQNTESFIKFDLLIALLCGLFILACFLSSFFPKSRLWGINHLAYFPLWVRVIFTLLGLSVLIPGLSSSAYNLLDEFLSFLPRIFEKRNIWGYALMSLISMFLFYLARTRTHLLGDGYTLISQLQSEKYLRMVFEPLELYSHLYAFKFLKLFILPSAESVYAGLSILAGGVFVFILLFLTRAFSEDRFERFFIFSIFLFSGATQLFLGYVENYTLTYVIIFAYLYFSLRYLQGKAKIYLPILFCVLSLGFHLSSVYLLPSLFFLFILKKKKGELVFSLKKAIPHLLILIFLLALFSYYIWSMNPAWLEIFVPVLKARPEAPGYTLFSISHLLDFLNQHLLLSPAGVILFLSSGVIGKKKIKFKDPIIGFLIAVLTAQLSYHFLVDPEFGAVRDWDLFSAMGLGYTFLGIFLFMNLIQSKKYPAIVLVFTVFLTTLLWFMLNANTGRSIERYKNLLDLDLKRSINGRYTLAIYYFQQNRLIESEETRAKIFSIFPEDSLNRAAQTYIHSGDYDQALRLLNKAMELNPGFLASYYNLGVVYLKQGKWDKAIDELQRLVRLNPYKAVIHASLGMALLQKGKLPEALSELKKAEKIGGVGPEVCSNIAYIYLTSGETEKALKYYKKALKMDPANYNVHFGLGQTYLVRNSLDEALDEFSQVVRLKSDFVQAYYFLALVYSRKGYHEKAIENYELFLRYSKDEALNEKVRELIQQLRSQSP